MPLVVNGVTVKNLVVNGVAVKTGIANGVTVFKSEEILFDNGVRGDLISGFTSLGSGNSVGTVISSYAYNYSEARVISSNKVDLTNYNKLCFESKVDADRGGWILIGYQTDTGQYSEITGVSVGDTSYTQYDIDISNVTGSYYIVFSRQYNAVNGAATTYTRKVWLE